MPRKRPDSPKGSSSLYLEDVEKNGPQHPFLLVFRCCRYGMLSSVCRDPSLTMTTTEMIMVMMVEEGFLWFYYAFVGLKEEHGPSPSATVAANGEGYCCCSRPPSPHGYLGTTARNQRER